MSEFITIFEKIERRTYLKGRLTGKFIGFLDSVNSDLKTENFYDLEITDVKVAVRRTDFRVWHEGGEFEEFLEAERFLTQIPNPVPCEITYEDKTVKYFNLYLNEPKLINYRLFNQLYEKNQLFATIEGEISGYLKHFDTVEKQIEKIEPAPKEEIKTQFGNSTFGNSTQGMGGSGNRWQGYSARQSFSGRRYGANNQGCAPALGCSTLPSGCISVLGILVFAYLCFAIFAMLLSAAAQIFIGIGPVILSFLFSVILPFFLVGSLLYLLVRLQHDLSTIWKWLFRLAVLILIFLLWLK